MTTEWQSNKMAFELLHRHPKLWLLTATSHWKKLSRIVLVGIPIHINYTWHRRNSPYHRDKVNSIGCKLIKSERNSRHQFSIVRKTFRSGAVQVLPLGSFIIDYARHATALINCFAFSPSHSSNKSIAGRKKWQWKDTIIGSIIHALFENENGNDVTMMSWRIGVINWAMTDRYFSSGN